MTITVALGGDTMLGRGVAEQIAAFGPYGLFADDVRQIFRSADLSLVNLECCVSARGEPWRAPDKPFHFRAPPQAADTLADLGIDCVTLANNHALDYGPEALTDTLDHLARAGVRVVGAGTDVWRAREPALFDTADGQVAVLGVTDHPNDFAAGEDRPGVAYADLRHEVPAWLTVRIRNLSAGGARVLVLAHWGPNMTIDPPRYVRAAARVLVDAGATLVAGHSAHVFHGVSGRVLYDLGDLIDDYAVDPALRNDLGLLFLATLAGRGFVRLTAVPLALESARTRLATGTDRAWIRDRFTTACATFGTTVTDEDGRLVVAHPAPGT
ncbi:CapA family protein [Actinoallomurus purpureus]|uniref:CapA family protein n=1 Tax=Actinoallomurus purpureus TaxID=478114 RepID=UPI0020931098|nr:CapA family protein [Actinoallomurus purpureus]MCO6007402.1 CapA family protein [Actinoallomurus purpureus]